MATFEELSPEASLAEWAYIEGYDAYLDDTSNPYDEYPHLSRAWQEGFEHAKRDQERRLEDEANSIPL